MSPLHFSRQYYLSSYSLPSILVKMATFLLAFRSNCLCFLSGHCLFGFSTVSFTSVSILLFGRFLELSFSYTQNIFHYYLISRILVYNQNTKTQRLDYIRAVKLPLRSQPHTWCHLFHRFLESLCVATSSRKKRNETRLW